MEAPQFPTAFLSLDRRSYIAFFIPYPLHPFSAVLHWDILHNPHQCSSGWIGASLFHATHLTCPPLPFQRSSASMGAPQSLSVLCSLDLALFFVIPHSFNTFFVLFFPTQHSPSGTHLLVVVAPVCHLNISYCLSNSHFDSQLADIPLQLC